jgi:hypothetical protein
VVRPCGISQVTPLLIPKDLCSYNTASAELYIPPLEPPLTFKRTRVRGGDSFTATFSGSSQLTRHIMTFDSVFQVTARTTCAELGNEGDPQPITLQSE